MYTSKNTIKQSEASIVPFKVQYPVRFSRSSESEKIIVNDLTIARFGQSNVLIRLGANYINQQIYYSPNIIIRSKGIVYKTIKHLYYENYITGSLLNSSSYWNANIQSTACSSSAEYENRYISTAIDKGVDAVCVEVIYIPTEYYGENIAKRSFSIRPDKPGDYSIVDDGNGNLIDIVNNNAHVGNIIYSQGVIIITNSDYFGTFSKTT